MLTERQHLNRVSELPIEEVFTDLDVNRNIQIDKSSGYRFEYPPKFIQTVLNNKVIGIRRLEVIPTSHVLKSYIRAYRMDQVPIFEGQWIDVNDNEGLLIRYRTKPNNWQTNLVETEFVFIEEGNQIEWERHGDNWIGTINKRAHQYRYECVYEPENAHPWAVYATYRVSTEVIEATFVQVLILISILEDNSLEEIVHKITSDFNAEAAQMGFDNIKLKFEYDNQKGKFTWIMFEDDFPTLWEIKPERKDTGPHLINYSSDIHNLIQFFNQDNTMDNYRLFVEPTYTKSFSSDVWDRKRVQFHSTFSHARNKYIGSNKDHFDSPSKLYRYVLTDPTFYIRFTTNGRVNFIPRYCSIIIELCFILNYQRTVLLD
jgi:hypothetical protein